MIYLDSAATTFPSQKSFCAQEDYFNVNANYAVKEKKLFANARDSIKKNMKIHSGDVVFGGNTTQLINTLMLMLKTME